MKTYPKFDEKTARKVAFEVHSGYISPRMVAKILATVPGVTDVEVRPQFGKWLDECEGAHARFRYKNVEGLVWEPFGDNSRYWIGQKESGETVDVSDVERAFEEYDPPLHRRVLGDLLTLRWLRR